MKTAIFYQRIFFTIFYVWATLLSGCTKWHSNKQSIGEKHINVVFRYDDYSAVSSKDIELRIIDAFRKNEASLTFSVIPFVCAGDIHDPSPQNIIPITSREGAILKTGFEDRVLDIALHGYSHQTIDAERNTEFSGLDYTSQIDRLAKGKKLLEGILDNPVTVFVPPWNQYDLNTLRALEELGFSTLSAGKNDMARKDSKLNFVPFSCGLPELRNAVEGARISADKESVIVVLFHEYDFRERNDKRGKITFQEFYDLLNWIKSQRDVRLLSVSQATKVIKNLMDFRDIHK